MLIEPVSARRRIYQVVGDILDAKRRQLGLTYRDLGTSSRQDFTYINKICNAKKDPDPIVISEIAGALKFDKEFLTYLEPLVLIPKFTEKLVEDERGYNIGRQLMFQRTVFSHWEALVVTAILASGLPEIAESYLGFYTPSHSFNQHFSPMFEELSEPLKLSAFGTLHQVIMNNKHEYSEDSCAKKHFALYYSGKYGDSRLKQEVREVLDSERSPITRRAGYIGLILGLDTESASRYLRQSSEDEQAIQADVEIHIEYSTTDFSKQ
jgi:transcriptional regulator with XRE-family HTH domain